MNENKKVTTAREQMEAWLKYATPGHEHMFLQRLEGRWSAKSKFWMESSEPSQESEGSSENRLILGGRFLQSTFSGNTPFGSFEGMSIDGFDQLGGKHVGIWMDSLQTMMMVFEGQIDKSGNVREMVSDHLDSMTGRPTQMKSRTTYINENEHIYEAFKKNDRRWLKSIEIKYTRKK